MTLARRFLQQEAVLYVLSSGDYVMPAMTMSMLLEMVLVILASPRISRNGMSLGWSFGNHWKEPIHELANECGEAPSAETFRKKEP